MKSILNPEREPITTEDLITLLELVSVETTAAVVDGWTADQRTEAEEWAFRTHLRASDNIIRVPPRPQFVPEPK